MTGAPETPRTSFGGAIASGFRHYARFDGRASMPEFWWFALFVALVSAGLGVIDAVFAELGGALGGLLSGGGLLRGGLFSSTLGPVSVGIGTGPLTALWALATLLPMLGLAVRRLHDGGNSALQLLWLLMPIAGLIVIVLRLCDPSRAATPGVAPADTVAVEHTDGPPAPPLPRI